MTGAKGFQSDCVVELRYAPGEGYSVYTILACIRIMCHFDGNDSEKCIIRFKVLGLCSLAAGTIE